MNCETVLARLQEAKAALHNLSIGQAPRVVVDSNGERVEYTAANINTLRTYISILEQEAALCGKGGGSGGFCGGAMRISIGG